MTASRLLAHFYTKGGQAVRVEPFTRAPLVTVWFGSKRNGHGCVLDRDDARKVRDALSTFIGDEDAAEPKTCPVCGAYPGGCVRGCTARSPWGAKP